MCIGQSLRQGRTEFIYLQAQCLPLTASIPGSMMASGPLATWMVRAQMCEPLVYSVRILRNSIPMLGSGIEG